MPTVMLLYPSMVLLLVHHQVFCYCSYTHHSILFSTHIFSVVTLDLFIRSLQWGKSPRHIVASTTLNNSANYTIVILICHLMFLLFSVAVADRIWQRSLLHYHWLLSFVQAYSWQQGKSHQGKLRLLEYPLSCFVVPKFQIQVCLLVFQRERSLQTHTLRLS